MLSSWDTQLEKAIEKRRSLSPSTSEGIDLHVRSIGLLVQGQNTFQKMASLSFLEGLSAKGIKAHVLWYWHKKPKDLESSSHMSYSDREIKRGIPQGEDVHKFLDIQMDALLVPSSDIPRHFEYIIAVSRAHLKVCNPYANSQYANFIVDVPQPVDCQYFYNETIKNIQNLCPKER